MRNPYLSLLSTAWNYSRDEKRKFILIYSLFGISSLIIAFNPILYGWFINGLQKSGTEVLSYAWIYVLGFLGLRLAEWAFHGPARVMERNLAFTMSRNFIDDLYYKVLHLPMNWHQNNHSGSTINRVRKGYESLKEFFQNGFVHLYAFAKFILSFVAMIWFSPLFGSIAVLLGFFTIWVIFKFDKPFIKSLKEVNERENVVSSTLFDSLSNIVTVITLRLEERMKENILSKVKRVFPAFRRNVVINEWKWFTAQMLVGLIYAVIVIGYVYQNFIPGQTFLIGGLVTLLVYVNQFTSVFNDVAYQYTRIIQYHTNVEMAIATIRDNNDELIKTDTFPLPQNWNTIEVKALNFIRPDKANKSSGLCDLDIQISRGKKIALIGESGGGKSTLLSVIRGLHAPESTSHIVVDKTQILPFQSISNTVTLFPQEPEIFENTILYNITLGIPFSTEDVLKACEMARFSEVVKNLPKGLDTHIKEKGVNLSGGQKQRLALARGILSASLSDIVLLDEPTSSVDPRTEMLIYDKLFESFSGKAVVSSLHRLHLLTKFDYIYILEKGRIIEKGTFRELIKNSEAFRNLWQHQEVKTLSVLDEESSEEKSLLA